MSAFKLFLLFSSLDIFYKFILVLMFLWLFICFTLHIDSDFLKIYIKKDEMIHK